MNTNAQSVQEIFKEVKTIFELLTIEIQGRIGKAYLTGRADERTEMLKNLNEENLN